MALTWLTPFRDHILERLGAAPDAMSDAALELAEQMIDEVTGVLWGATHAGVEIEVHIPEKSMSLRVPIDTLAVNSVTPEIDGAMVLDEGRVYFLDAGGVRTAIGPGAWKLNIDRGITEIPRRVIDAAALIAASYLQPPDPDRSRFENIRLGDFAGRWNNLSATGVPEADNLLAPWLERVNGRLV